MLTTKVWHSRHNLNYRLKTKFRRKLIAFQKKNPKAEPLSVDSKVLAINWWAKAWNANLKKYTTNNVQLEKGKLNFRCEALADLRIEDNVINGTVLGSKIDPYEVEIIMNPITQTNWKRIKSSYNGRLDLFEKILGNHFPKEMTSLFTSKPTGLFPATKDISFECTCSERATICRHTAAVLYGVGTKLDTDPQLLLRLRGVDIVEFISDSIHKERKEILKRINKKQVNTLGDDSLTEIFKLNV